MIYDVERDRFWQLFTNQTFLRVKLSSIYNNSQTKILINFALHRIQYYKQRVLSEQNKL